MIVNFLIESRYGGPQMILAHLIPKIKERNRTIYLDLKNNGFLFSDLKKINKIFFIFDIFFNLISLLVNYKKFRNEKIFFVFSLVNIVPVIFGIILKKKIVWYILEKPNFIFYSIFKILNLYPKLEIICISKSLAKMLKIKKYNLYFPPIKQNFWKKNTKSKGKIFDKFKRIVCVGNLNRAKNHIKLIEYLEFSKIKYKLIIIGKKIENQKNYFNNLVEIKNKINLNKINEVKIYQNKKSNFIKEVLSKSDIFILPSLEEGLSIALIEAMCMKTLCLVSKPSNHSKIIINHKNGYEFELNKQSFALIFNKICKFNGITKRKISSEARQTAIKLISKNIFLEKKVINKLLSVHH